MCGGVAPSWDWNPDVPPPGPASGCPRLLSPWLGVGVAPWGLSFGTVDSGREGMGHS